MSQQPDNSDNQITLDEESGCCGGHHCCEELIQITPNETEEPNLMAAEHPPEEHVEKVHAEKVHAEKEPQEKGHNKVFEQFVADLGKQPDAESKLRFVIQFMESSLAQTGTPHFKNFWEARKLSLPLFKENISQTGRALLWARYMELSEEARRLRDLLDEQSAFAAEQIEIAIKALEEEVERNAQIVEEGAAIDFPADARSLKAKFNLYSNLQQELNLLNNQAARINGLRKELIRTEMRIRTKNKLFQRLSLLGDKVFPRRKALIKEVSDQFTADIQHFIDDQFKKEGALSHMLFDFREEIKALQGVAKILTLNTSAFTQTRTRLSECWDTIKKMEKERKKERAVQREAFKQNYDQVLAKIVSFTEEFQAGSLSVNDANQQIEQIVTLMRQVDLGRDELRHLRDQLNNARKLVLDKVKVEEHDRHQHEQEKEKQRREKITLMRQAVDHLLKSVEGYDADRITSERDQLLTQIQEVGITRQEKQELERLLKPLKDLIAEKKEQAIMNLSADDQESLQQLRIILKDRKERRQEVKNQLEIYRKAGGNSLDFEKAMQLNVQINAEKERLEKINESIEEIEEKISDLREKI